MTDDYVRHQNIQRFEQMLGSESDPLKRLQIERLLAEERARTQPGRAEDPRRAWYFHLANGFRAARRSACRRIGR